jgi:electron transfer flavoprotein beta subunit
MRIVVCIKEVLDPDAVNNYALAGRLEIGEDGKSLTQSAIPRLINAYDEQAIEAALRLRDAGPAGILKHAAALGADEIAAIQLDPAETDYHGVARLLAAYVSTSGGADLVLCGRQASDDDQGVVPALIGEQLGMPVVAIARAVELAGSSDTPALKVTRVTPDGDEIVEASCPAVVTISNELGDPRFPTTAKKIAARRMKPTLVSLDDLSLSLEDLHPRVSLTRQFVPTVQGNCEFLSGETPAELAQQLIGRLREDSVLQ